MKKTNILLIIVLLIFNNIIYSQKSDPSHEQLISNFEKIKNQLPSLQLNDMPIEHNGRLKFRDRNHFTSFKNQLSDYYDNEINLGEKSDYYLDPEDTTILDPDGVLIAFENNFPNFESIRSKMNIQESFDLLNGKDPYDIESPKYSTDDITNSLINSKYEFQIGDTIINGYKGLSFFVPSETAYQELIQFRENDEDINPWIIDPDIKIMRIERDLSEPCEAIADFQINGKYLKYSFTFTGKPQIPANGFTVSYHWTFGDGNTSEEKNPNHEYAEKGTYSVCLYLVVRNEDASEVCIDNICYEVVAKEKVDNNDCEWFEALKATFVWNETGTPGELCFTGVGNLFSEIYDQDLVVSWEWNFGDNSTSDEQFPCHIFPCDKQYTVTLNVITESGCKQTFTLPVTVNSYKCCDDDAGDSGIGYYSDSKGDYKYKWSQYLNAVWPYWWSIRYELDSKLKHYKHYFFGYYRKKAPLSIEISGNGYTKTATGCTCEIPKDISEPRQNVNSWKMRIHKTFGGKVKTKYQFDWNGKYWIKNDLKVDKNTQAICD